MGRAPCCDKANVKRGAWSPEEDQVLRNHIEKNGTDGNWISLPRKAGLNRCGKSCRLRWLNYLRPDIKRGGFTEEEDEIICSLYIQLGSRWSIIASHLCGRTDNDVKNYWNTKLKKKLMATYPATQTPAAAAAVDSEANCIVVNPVFFAINERERDRSYSTFSSSSSLMTEQREVRSEISEQEGPAASSSTITVEGRSSISMGYESWPAGEDSLLLTESDMGWISELLATPREAAPPPISCSFWAASERADDSHGKGLRE